MIKIITMLVEGISKGTIGTVDLVLFLLIIITLSVLLYKNTKTFKAIYNFIANLLPFIKREHVVVANFSKQPGTINKVIENYIELGCKTYLLNTYKKFKENGSISKTVLEEIIQKQQKTIRKAKSRLNTPNSFIYIGFPHIPLGFLDGINFNDTDMPILYEHQHEDCEQRKKGLFELNQIYNTNLKLVDNVHEIPTFDEEIAIKIEQSFKISDNDILEILKNIQVIKFGVEDTARSGISNYSQIDIYKKEFNKFLTLLSEKGVKKIHLFATSPATLSFSLGSVIKHYHPEIIVYNYNRTKFDWGINLKNQEVVMCSSFD